jgi:hypothetical protein
MGTRVWGALALLLGVWWASTGLAADWSLIPSVNAKTEFNSNLNYTSTAPVSDFIFSLAPAVEFNYASQISKIQGKLGLMGLHYLSHSDIDHIDQSYQINVQHQFAPRWKFSLSSSYIVDSTLQEELLTSGLVMTRTPRQSIQFGPAVTYNLTERLAATVNYNFNKVNYQDPQFQNFISQLVGLKLEYPLKNQKTVLIGNVIGRESRYPSEDNIFRSLGIYLGANHKLSEKWEASILAGVNVSFYDFHTQVLETAQAPFFFTTRQARVQQTTSSPFVNLSATRRWTNLSVTGGYSRDQSASAFGSISEMNRLYLSMAYKYNERLSGSLSGDYSLSNQVSQQINQETDYFSISPQASYQITEKLSLSPGYKFGLREDITGGSTAKAHSVWLMLTYSYPIYYQK